MASSNISSSGEDHTLHTDLLDIQGKKSALTATSEEIKTMLNVIENEIIPLTSSGVGAGNKVFGAAILRPDLTCDVASTNAETVCPLFHGEVKCIYDWSAKTPASNRGPLARSSIFLSTHEPCCMCIASILWTGFTKLFYFLPYETTTAQGIPHDVNTMHELWGVSGYRRQNKYFASACLQELIRDLPESEVKQDILVQSSRLLQVYNSMSDQYHAEKKDNKNNTLVLD